MKYGWISKYSCRSLAEAVLTLESDGQSGTSDTRLQWHVGGQSKWAVELVADVWHNVAYEIVSSYDSQTKEADTDMSYRTSPASR